VERSLIDYDFGAHVIWIVRTQDEMSRAPQSTDASGWQGARPPGSERPRPWSNLLTKSLLDDLQRWNDWGCRLARSPSKRRPPGIDWEAFYRDAEDLARRTQMELGAQWQVLWSEGSAWHFVRWP
jgi:hypothetical protein